MINRLERLEALAKERPDDAFTLFALAKEYEKSGDLLKSLTVYSDLTRKQPDYVGTYFHLGKLLEDLDQEENALNAYETGISVAKKIGDHHALAELSNAAQNLRLEM